LPAAGSKNVFGFEVSSPGAFGLEGAIGDRFMREPMRWLTEDSWVCKAKGHKGAVTWASSPKVKGRCTLGYPGKRIEIQSKMVQHIVIAKSMWLS
jgi:hypothetical protein